MRIGICPGSFDPVTNGHVDVFERSAKLVDKLIIAIFANPGKHPLFSMEEREELLRQAVGHIPNVEVVSFQGLLNEYAVERGATVIIRELACFGGKLDGLVPDFTAKRLKEKFKDKYQI